MVVKKTAARKTAARKKTAAKKGPPKVIVREITMFDPNDPWLKQYPGNPRVGNMKVIRESFEENDMFEVIIAQKSTGYVLSGNHRLKVAIELGMTEIPVGIVDVTDARARKMVLAPNRANDLATYDSNAMSQLLELIDNPIGTGFNKDDYDALVDGIEHYDTKLVDAVIRPDLQIQQPEGDNSVRTSSIKKPVHVDTKTNEEKYAGLKDEDEDIGGIDTVESHAQIQAALIVSEETKFDSGNYYGIPDLLPNMLLQELPAKFETWGGLDATTDDGVTTYLWNYGVASRKGLPADRAVLGFYCVDQDTEALTKRGWVRGDDLTTDDVILSCDPADGKHKWSPVHEVFRKHYSGKMHHLTSSSVDHLITPGHNLLTNRGLVKVEDLKRNDVVKVIGESIDHGGSVYSDAFIELVAWAITEGHYRPGKNTHGVVITQKIGSPGEDRIRHCLKVVGAHWTEHRSGSTSPGDDGPSCRAFSVTKHVANLLHSIAPNRIPKNEFIHLMDAAQLRLFIETCIDADGWRPAGKGRQIIQKDESWIDMFAMVCAIAGISTKRGYHTPSDCHTLTLRVRTNLDGQTIDYHGGFGDGRKGEQNHPTVDYEGTVWCPRTNYGTFVCRRNGHVFVTGNTFDAYFESWWNDPAYYVAKVMAMGVKTAVVPDFSLWNVDPTVFHLYNVFRAQWLGRFFQEAGLMLIPRLQMNLGDGGRSLDFCTMGIPKDTPVLAASAQHSQGKEDFKNEVNWTIKCLKELTPKTFLVYGGNPGLRMMEAVREKMKTPDIEFRHIYNYSHIRRGVAYDKKEGLASKKEKQRLKRDKCAEPEEEEAGEDA